MSAPAPRRTIFTTVVGAAAILLGVAGSLFSLFALVLAMGKPYASTFDPAGILVIFILPPGTLLAGVCLLLRQRWARWWMILLMAGLVLLGLQGLIAPDHANPAYAPRPGPAADALKRGVFVRSVACITLGGLVLCGLVSGPVRREFRKPAPLRPQALSSAFAREGPPPTPQDEQLGWRVGHRGRDMMFYEERHGDGWRRMEIDGEMLTGRAHHVIYFASAETWQGYPEWARHRRDEIIARVKSRFREPDYEYAENGSAPAVRPQPVAGVPSPKQDGTILPVLGFLALLAVACFWFAARGVERGEIRLPVKHNPASRMVLRAEKPALFWTSVGLLGAAGAGCTALAAWLAVSRLRRSV